MVLLSSLEIWAKEALPCHLHVSRPCQRHLISHQLRSWEILRDLERSWSAQSPFRFWSRHISSIFQPKSSNAKALGLGYGDLFIYIQCMKRCIPSLIALLNPLLLLSANLLAPNRQHSPTQKASSTHLFDLWCTKTHLKPTKQTFSTCSSLPLHSVGPNLTLTYSFIHANMQPLPSEPL